MPTNKQRRQAAQRRLQRQLERRAEIARRRRRTAIVAVSALAVLVVVGAVLLVTGLGGDAGTATASGSSTPAAASGSAAPTSAVPAAVTNADGTVTCTYTPDPSSTSTVGTPPDAGATPAQGTATIAMVTSQGDLTLTLDRAGAPCAAASLVHLSSTGFFNGTPCHRETDSAGLKVLQCGDPTGTGTGGPGYSFPTDVKGTETYPRGTIAMANAGQGSDGSQFFLVYGDSQLPPDYTVVGTVDQAGLATLDAIAATGNDGSNGPDDGKPTTPVTITSMTVTS